MSQTQVADEMRPARKRKRFLAEAIYNSVLAGIRLSFRIQCKLMPERASERALRYFTKPQRLKPRWRDGVPRPECFDTHSESGRLSGYRWVPEKTLARVLLVHGWSSGVHHLQYLVKPLLDAGCEVVAFDAAGHGLSDGQRVSLPEFVEGVTALDKSKGGFDVMVGHSLGGAALSYAVSERRVTPSRLALMASPADIVDVTRRFARFLGVSEPVREAMQKRIEQHYGLPMSALSVESYGSGISIPVLLIHDKADEEIPFSDALRFEKALPDVRLHPKTGLGHRKILRDEGALSDLLDFIVEKKSEIAGSEH